MKVHACVVYEVILLLNEVLDGRAKVEIKLQVVWRKPPPGVARGVSRRAGGSGAAPSLIHVHPWSRQIAAGRKLGTCHEAVANIHVGPVLHLR